MWRFNAFHRWTHGLVVVSFFLLVITGLPLRFGCAFWSEPLMALLGGVERAGLLHRVGAVITLGYFASHLAYLLVRFVRTDDRSRLLWGPDSMVPQPRDLVDLGHQLRWFLGRGPRPRFGRWSYMEKFDYFAVFWGVVIIGTSGLVLWFPDHFARILPGWAFNVATIVHGEEALLAAGFIFTIHFFNVHLRPEKFPLDAVMFTGRATAEYMTREHPALAPRIESLADRAAPCAQLPDTPAPPPTFRASLVAAVLGFAALGVGVALIGMILWAIAFC